MNLEETLQSVRKLALERPEIREKLLKTAESENAVREFCSICTELGYPIYEMDLVMAGEEYYAAMRRSTNGGGENSPLLQGSDDYYELFISDLK